MTSKSKVKGNGFERELVQAANDAGLEAKRAWGSDGRSFGQSKEVDLLIEGWMVQAKRRAKIPKWLSLEGVGAVAVREDRGETIVVIRLDTFLGFLRKGE